MALKQGENKSVRDFVGRFHGDVTIPNLQQEVVALSLMLGLKYGNFRSYLRRKSLKTLAIVLGKGKEFIKSEEFNRVSNARRGDSKVAKEDKRGGSSRK